MYCMFVVLWNFIMLILPDPDSVVLAKVVRTGAFGDVYAGVTMTLLGRRSNQ